MLRARLLLAWPLLLVGAGCADEAPSPPVETSHSSDASAAVVDALEDRARALIPAGVVAGLLTAPEGFRPVLDAWPHVAGTADVVLGANAAAPTTLTDIATGMRIRFRLEDAERSSAEIAHGFVVYRDALGVGAHVVRATDPFGTEEFISENEPREVRYRIELTYGVAGLRLVENVLEFLDGEGTPRLRATAPWALDAFGFPHPVDVALSGCEHSVSPIAPWGQPVISSGARECQLRVSVGDAVRGPVWIDPKWTTTGAMVSGHAQHSATRLLDGRVLVAGSSPNEGTGSLSELFDPATKTWAATGSLHARRWDHRAALIQASGKVLLAGGRYYSPPQNGPTTAAEVYDPASGTWTLLAVGMKTPRLQHTLTALPSGRLMVAGGAYETPDVTTEIFDPSTMTFSPGPSMTAPRSDHAASILNDGRVLVSGGWFSPGDNNVAETDSAEIFSETENGWTATGSLLRPREAHIMETLSDGSVVVANGLSQTNAGEHEAVTPTAERFDQTTEQWTALPSVPHVRADTQSAVMPNGCVFLPANDRDSNNQSIGAVDMFDPRAETWATLTPKADATVDNRVAVLIDGSLLVTGGLAPFTTTAQVLALGGDSDQCSHGCECDSGVCADGKCCSGTKLPGAKCDSACQCKSGFCADGVCCDKACDGLCEACTLAAKGSGEDGTCGPTESGQDPRDDCKAEQVSTCGTTGVCDGNRACAMFKNETKCAAPTCQGHELVTSECKDARCSATTTDCSPFTCKEDPPGCVESCKNISDCAKGFVCTDDHECIPTPQNNPDTDSSGCCGVAGRGPEQPWFVALLPAAVALAFARRRTRRG